MSSSTRSRNPPSEPLRSLPYVPRGSTYDPTSYNPSDGDDYLTIKYGCHNTTEWERKCGQLTNAILQTRDVGETLSHLSDAKELFDKEVKTRDQGREILGSHHDAADIVVTKFNEEYGSLWMMITGEDDGLQVPSPNVGTDMSLRTMRDSYMTMKQTVDWMRYHIWRRKSDVLFLDRAIKDEPHIDCSGRMDESGPMSI